MNASQSVSHLELIPSADVRFLKGSGMIRSHIGSTQECGVVLKLDGFSHLIGWSFGLGSSIRLEYLSERLFPFVKEKTHH